MYAMLLFAFKHMLGPKVPFMNFCFIIALTFHAMHRRFQSFRHAVAQQKISRDTNMH